MTFVTLDLILSMTKFPLFDRTQQFKKHIDFFSTCKEFVKIISLLSNAPRQEKRLIVSKAFPNDFGFLNDVHYLWESL